MTFAPGRVERPSSGHDRERAIAVLHEALDRLRFGAIVLTVHDGRVVQLEITERRRFDT